MRSAPAAGRSASRSRGRSRSQGRGGGGYGRLPEDPIVVKADSGASAGAAGEARNGAGGD